MVSFDMGWQHLENQRAFQYICLKCDCEQSPADTCQEYPLNLKWWNKKYIQVSMQKTWWIWIRINNKSFFALHIFHCQHDLSCTPAPSKDPNCAWAVSQQVSTFPLPAFWLAPAETKWCPHLILFWWSSWCTARKYPSLDWSNHF